MFYLMLKRGTWTEKEKKEFKNEIGMSQIANRLPQKTNKF